MLTTVCIAFTLLGFIGNLEMMQSFKSIVHRFRSKLKKAESCSAVSDPLWTHGLYSPWNFPDQSTGMGSCSLLQGIFPTQVLNPGLLLCRQISLPAEPRGKPKNTGVGSLTLLQRIFPTHESNQGLLHCRRILYQLSYQGSPYHAILYKGLEHQEILVWGSCT